MRVNHRETDLENHDRGLDYDLPRLLQRRGMLKLVAGAGLAGTGLITLAACGDATTTDTGSTAPGPAARRAADLAASRRAAAGEGRRPERRDQRHRQRRDAGGDRRTLSRRRLQRRERADRERRGAQRHHLQLRLEHDQGRGRPADRHDDDQRLRQRTSRRWPAPRSTSGTATGRAGTRSTPRRSPNENYLRGVQETDDKGQVKFTTIFPACYDGRWPHIHFEVYPSLAKATNSANKIATSQMALPEEACKAVYATAGYEQSVQNLSQGQPGHRQRLQRRLRPADPHHHRRPHQGLRLSSPARFRSELSRRVSSRASAVVPPTTGGAMSEQRFPFAKSTTTPAIGAMRERTPEN